MRLFQRPASEAADVEASAPLALPPEEVEKLDEAGWLAKAYRPAATQLTWRAVALGGGIGFFLAFTNVYVGLKTSFHFGVNLTACILAYAVGAALTSTGLFRSRLSILETSCAVSTASSAGYATGNTLISAFPALLLLSVDDAHPRGTSLPWLLVAAWVGSVALLGIAMAITLKRDLVDREKLKFPSGTAAAVMLQGLHRRGAEGLAKARALFVAAAVAALFPITTALGVNAPADAKSPRTPLLPDQSNVFDGLAKLLPAAWTARMFHAGGQSLLPSSYKLVLGHGLLPAGAGMLVGLRITAWMVVGGLFLAGVLAPTALEWPWQDVAGKTVYAAKSAGGAVSQLGPWCGAPLLVTSSLVTFAWRWRSIGRALAKLARKGPREADDAARGVELPLRWFAAGGGLSGLVLILLGWRFFDIPPHLGLLAVVMTFALASVASRVMGESDIAPTGPLGKVMQLTYGVLGPRSAVGNVQSASITAGASIASADLLNDLKTGHLLGADPRRQLVAQALGIVFGTIGTVTAFFVLVPDASALGSGHDQFAVPAAVSWRVVATLMTEGLANVHPMHRWLILFGSVAGVVLQVAEKLAPKRLRWLPSPTGLGIGMVLPFEIALGMLLGAVAGELAKAVDSVWAERYLVVVAAGAIAGESILGIVVHVVNTLVAR